MSAPPPDLGLVVDALDVVLRCFDPARDRVTVVGGLAPLLLVPSPVGEPHVGTADIDLCLTVAVADAEAGDASDGAAPVAALQAAGFEQAPDPRQRFRWRGHGVAVDFLYPAARGERPVRTQRDPIRGLGDLAALAVPCRHLVEASRVRVPLRPPLGGGPGPGPWAYVTGPAAFAALKGYAIEGREKHKDAYDLVWLLDEVGPDDAGREAAQIAAGQPLVAAELADAVDTLAHLFQPGHVGPTWYATFLGEVDPVRRAQDERFAVETVARFLDAAGRGT